MSMFLLPFLNQQKLPTLLNKRMRKDILPLKLVRIFLFLPEQQVAVREALGRGRDCDGRRSEDLYGQAINGH